MTFQCVCFSEYSWNSFHATATLNSDQEISGGECARDTRDRESGIILYEILTCIISWHTYAKYLSVGNHISATFIRTVSITPLSRARARACYVTLLASINYAYSARRNNRSSASITEGVRPCHACQRSGLASRVPSRPLPLRFSTRGDGARDNAPRRETVSQNVRGWHFREYISRIFVFESDLISSGYLLPSALY